MIVHQSASGKPVTRRKTVVHKAVLTAKVSGGPGGTMNPKIPARFRPKRKPSPSPSPSLRGFQLPSIGKAGKSKPGLAVPVPQPGLAAPQSGPGRVNIPHPVPAVPVYANPLRAIKGLTPERIDQGVDYGGTGPIYAPGPGVITNTGIGQSTGWAGPPEAGVNPGGYVAERLTAGPAKGQTVYFAEGLTPTVRTGQKVGTGSKIADMSAAIETGFASGSGTGTMAAATGELGGPTSTAWGNAWSQVLHKLGAPAGIVQSGGVGVGNVPNFAAGLKPGGSFSLPQNITNPGIPTRVTIPHAGSVPTVSGVEPSNSSGTVRGTGIRGHGKPPGPEPKPPTKTLPGPVETPPVKVPGGTSTPPGSVTTSTAPPTFINSSVGTGGVIAPAAASTGSGGGLGTLLLLGGGAVLVFLLLSRKGKPKPA